MLEQLKIKLLINLSITNLDMTKDLLKLCEKILDKSHKNKIWKHLQTTQFSKATLDHTLYLVS